MFSAKKWFQQWLRSFLADNEQPVKEPTMAITWNRDVEIASGQALIANEVDKIKQSKKPEKLTSKKFQKEIIIDFLNNNAEFWSPEAISKQTGICVNSIRARLSQSLRLGHVIKRKAGLSQFNRPIWEFAGAHPVEKPIQNLPQIKLTRLSDIAKTKPAHKYNWTKSKFTHGLRFETRKKITDTVELLINDFKIFTIKDIQAVYGYYISGKTKDWLIPDLSNQTNVIMVKRHNRYYFIPTRIELGKRVQATEYYSSVKEI